MVRFLAKLLEGERWEAAWPAGKHLIELEWLNIFAAVGGIALGAPLLFLEKSGTYSGLWVAIFAFVGIGAAVLAAYFAWVINKMMPTIALRVRIKPFIREEPFDGAVKVVLYSDNSKRQIYTAPTGESFPIAPYCLSMRTKGENLPTGYAWNLAGEFFVERDVVNMQVLEEGGSIFFPAETASPSATLIPPTEVLRGMAETQAPYEAPKEEPTSKKVLNKIEDIWKNKRPPSGSP